MLHADKVCFGTGAGSERGLGLATAEFFAARGAKGAVLDLDPEVMSAAPPLDMGAAKGSSPPKEPMMRPTEPVVLKDEQGFHQGDFQPISRGLLSEDVVNEIRRLLATGRLRPGDKLPSERDLVQALKVSRSVVRDAVQRLTALGILEQRRGTGTFISAALGSSRPDRVFDLPDLSSNQLSDLLEAVTHIEIALVSLAIERFGANRDQIRPSIASSSIKGEHVWSVVRQAARSPVLVDLHCGLAEQILALAGQDAAAALSDKLEQERRAILTGIVSGDASAARDAVPRHAASRCSFFDGG